MDHKTMRGINLYETAYDVIAEALVPGVAKRNVSIEVDQDVVHVSGSTHESPVEQRRYFMTQIDDAYDYTFRLPAGVDRNRQPDTHLSQGVLTVIFTKSTRDPYQLA